MKQLKKLTRKHRALLLVYLGTSNVDDIRFVQETKYEYIFKDIVKGTDIIIKK